MLVESLVRGCTSWSKTIATPLIPAVKVRAKALSMGSLPSSAPMFHWLFAWSKFSTRRRKRIFHRSLNTLFTGTLPVHLQSSKRSSAWMSYPTSSHMFHCHAACLRNKHETVVMGSCSTPSCKRTDPICCIDPRSGALFGQSMALDRLHKVRKAGAPGMGPYPKRKEAFWSRTEQRPHKRWRKGKHISFNTLPKAMVK